MFPIPTPTSRTVPQRSDSLQPGKPIFSQIEEELRDVRRVHTQGQEEDLRMALARTITRVEELVRIVLLCLFVYLRVRLRPCPSLLYHARCSWMTMILGHIDVGPSPLAHARTDVDNNAKRGV